MEALAVSDIDVVALVVTVGLALTLDVNDCDAVTVTVALDVLLGEPLTLLVKDRVEVKDVVAVTVALPVGVFEEVPVTVAVTVCVGVGDGLELADLTTGQPQINSSRMRTPLRCKREGPPDLPECSNI